MLDIAFKEWAAVCRALADGRQAVILRKGGISEEGGVFTPDHARFWLLPTFAHQQDAGLVPAAAPLLAAAKADRPPDGTLRLTHVAEVAAVRFVTAEAAALALEGLHVWSADTVRQRFHYRTPGLYVLAVRVFRAGAADVPDRPEYAGCKTWVPLDPGAEDNPAEPMLDDAAFAGVLAEIGRRLG